ncbi:MAG TPA: response regulator transcription factor [Saprospiraceae bacterium]|nr:response regulator transcription factor [Saprospiraceae bacterium]
MIRVFIIDDHKMVIEGIELMLGQEENVELVGFALSAEDGIDRLTGTVADVLLLDINLPGINGIDACKIIHKRHPDLKIVALSMLKDSSLIKMMLKNGAAGYVLKNAGKDEIVAAIETVFKGKKYLDQEVNDIIISSITGQNTQKSNPFPSLSRREKEVLRLILEELTTKEIAEKLFISAGTVETHRRNMLAKVGARNTAGLVRIAIEYGLVK